MKCFVGRLEFIPELEKVFGPIPFFDLPIHPLDFEDYVKTISGNIATNNIFMADCFTGEDLFIINDDGKYRPLSDHPKYNYWKDEFQTGELWSFFGAMWIDEYPIS
jgi:hypothetical protein